MTCYEFAWCGGVVHQVKY